jgi:hypothetical protein
MYYCVGRKFENSSIFLPGFLFSICVNCVCVFIVKRNELSMLRYHAV